MTKTQIAKRYGKLLINTVDVNDIPRVIEEMKVFSKLLEEDKKFRILFESPIFSEDEKSRSLTEILSRLKGSQHTEKLLKLLILRGHLFAIDEVIKALIDAYNEKLKKLTAVVISSVALDNKNIERLKSALKAMTQREVDIENRIDPSLLGGFVVTMGSTIYDSSIKGQINLLRAELAR